MAQTRMEKLQAELAVAEAEQALVEAKAGQERCSECGRRKPRSPEQEESIRAAKARLAAVRDPHRKARQAARAGSATPETVEIGSDDVEGVGV